MKYIIDTKSNDKHFIVKTENGNEFLKMAKSCNDIEAVKRFIGVMNIKEII